MFIKDIPAIILFLILFYGGVAMVSLIACILLCFRKGNAFNADITPPVRLRRWAVAFFALSFFGYLWWILFYIYSGDVQSMSYIMLYLYDCLTMLIIIPCMLLAMLQDRKRRVLPIILATIPIAVLGTLNTVYPGGLFQIIEYVYFSLLYIIFIIYMVFAVRQYGRWLRDNYADLENKEIWLSHVLIIVIMLLIIIYGLDDDNKIVISYIVQVIQLVLYGFLLWRIETLPQLENLTVERPEEQPGHPIQQPMVIPFNIEQLLEEQCVNTQLYLQHDLTLHHLALTIGTNQMYLSQYFSRKGINYNAYINNLRINHFVELYREAADAEKPITAQQLAHDSGYRSYSTFSLAFKQRMGQSVTSWMRKTEQ